MSIRIKKGRSGTLDFTPMIDMVFNLLIFFLVATKFEEEERSIHVELPTASQAMPLTVRPKELFVNVDKDGRIVVAVKEYTPEQLFELLRRASEGNPGRQTVVIRADKNCPLQPVVTVMDLCNKANIRDYRLTTAAAPGS